MRRQSGQSRLCRLIWKLLHEAAQHVEYGPAVSALTLKRRTARRATSEARVFGSANPDLSESRFVAEVFSREGRAGDCSPIPISVVYLLIRRWRLGIS